MKIGRLLPSLLKVRRSLATDLLTPRHSLLHHPLLQPVPHHPRLPPLPHYHHRQLRYHMLTPRHSLLQHPLPQPLPHHPRLPPLPHYHHRQLRYHMEVPPEKENKGFDHDAGDDTKEQPTLDMAVQEIMEISRDLGDIKSLLTELVSVAKRKLDEEKNEREEDEYLMVRLRMSEFFGFAILIFITGWSLIIAIADDERKKKVSQAQKYGVES